MINKIEKINIIEAEHHNEMVMTSLQIKQQEEKIQGLQKQIDKL